MALRQERETTAYIKVEISAESSANRTFRSINPTVSNANLVDGLVALGQLQSHTVQAYTRQDKATLMSD